MHPNPRKFAVLAACAVCAIGMSASAQDQSDPAVPNANIVVEGQLPAFADMTPGPEIRGTITARRGDRMKVTTADGTEQIVAITPETAIRSGGGLFGGGRRDLTANDLLNGLPVTVKTLQTGEILVARQVNFRSGDFRTAAMIRNATSQSFAEQTAATEALRSRVADIGQYNVKSTTNVNFDVGKAALSAQAQNDLCAAATTAEGMSNAILLVVGYTDSTGSAELNQELSEKRAGRVVNYLQQACGWKPYRMLTPTGMAEADPMASNDTYEGKAQNRRVSVNILVSKSVDGL